jgi:spermidine synthase
MNSVLNTIKNITARECIIFLILGAVAACGLMYEYMLSSYTARVLGSTEKVIFTVILYMLLAMGVGAAILPRFVKNNYNGFSIIESLISVFGSMSIVLVSVSHGFGYVLPAIVAETFQIPLSEVGGYGMISSFANIISYTPYFLAIIIGLLVGAEIPIMTNIRQDGATSELKNNMGTMYGVDYVGAFIGGMIWLYLLHAFRISDSAVIIASTNIAVGFIFMIAFRKRITAWKTIVPLNVFSILCVLFVNSYGWDVERWSEQLLYKDKIVYQSNTEFQKFVITEREFKEEPNEFRFYINGSTQISSADEAIYHSMLVTPAMLAANATTRYHNMDVMVVGGGDGLAVRNILKWNPRSVTLLDLDGDVIEFFTNPRVVDNKVVNKELLELNEFSFQDPRVTVILGDAFLSADKLIQQRKKFDVIIIDLPDPNHPDLTKLYSTVFYDKVNFLLSDSGVVAVQSTSPYSAKETFQCVKKTMEENSFSNVEQYHVNVPSFGEWGFTISKKDGTSAKESINNASSVYPDDSFSTKELIAGSFNFGKNFYKDYDKIKVNYIDTIVIYQYHEKNWEKMIGTYRTDI